MRFTRTQRASQKSRDGHQRLSMKARNSRSSWQPIAPATQSTRNNTYDAKTANGKEQPRIFETKIRGYLNAEPVWKYDAESGSKKRVQIEFFFVPFRSPLDRVSCEISAFLRILNGGENLRTRNEEKRRIRGTPYDPNDPKNQQKRRRVGRQPTNRRQKNDRQTQQQQRQQQRRHHNKTAPTTS